MALKDAGRGFVRTPRTTNFRQIHAQLMGWLAYDADPVDTQSWQSQDVSTRPEFRTHELRQVVFETPITDTKEAWAAVTSCNLPWAEDHFQERVSGEPWNPPPSEQWWPYAVQGNAAHKEGEKFSHTYPERMWPKFAGELTWGEVRGLTEPIPHRGIRYELGDLGDLIALMSRDPMTRQAYLPIWFPEDTGSNQGQRVPCTLGYHFMIRHGQVSCTYFIRSCDFMRHFQDDVYMAGRLCQWVVEELDMGLRPGNLIMHIGSLHIFEGDVENIRRMAKHAH